MKIIKTALAFLLIGILSISLCACSADQEDNFSTKIKNKIELINSHEFVLRVEEETSEISKSDMKQARSVLEQRLFSMGFRNYEIKIDYDSKEFIIKIPREIDGEEVNYVKTAAHLCNKSELRFYLGDGNLGEPFMTEAEVSNATVGYDDSNGYYVSLKFNQKGTEAFADATTTAYSNNIHISIYLDGTAISVAAVNEPITTGDAIITGNFSKEQAELLVDQLNSGSLPFSLYCDE